MRILIVDDDKIIRMGLSKKIKRLFNDYEVMCNFQNGLVALEYLKENENKVDLVITDIKMPIMTGLELIERSLKELRKSPVFIVLSGYDEFNYVRDSMKAGATNYLLKPIKEEELKRALKEVEAKINYIKRQDKIINKSIDILKNDFFKYILFSSKNININTNKALLENMQLDEDYIYNMIVIERKAEEDKKLLTYFIKSIVKRYTYLESLFFYYENSIYVIFYFDNNDCNNQKELRDEIISGTNIFIEHDKNVYILEATEKVWNLRKQSRLVMKVRESMVCNCKAKQYYLNESDNLLDVFKEYRNNSNTIAIDLAKKYIINNFNKNITLKDVAQEVYLSHNYLSELFKKEVGEGFYDFLSKYRIKKAKEILMTTNLKIYEIAEDVGYSDSITFGRAFKKITGITPNSFRNIQIKEKIKIDNLEKRNACEKI